MQMYCEQADREPGLKQMCQQKKLQISSRDTNIATAIVLDASTVKKIKCDARHEYGSRMLHIFPIPICQ